VFANETFRLHVVDRPDPAEVVGWIREGLVTLRVPLPRRKIHLGPFSWSLQSVAELRVQVADGLIQREHARGHLDPPVRLPLGFEVEQIHLSPEGDVMLGLRGLPDLNLSAVVPGLPRIPASLRELGERIGRDGRSASPTPSPQKPGETGSSSRGPGRERTPPDPESRIEVFAERVRPLAGVVVDLGPAGRLELGASTELDLAYTGGRLTCTGRLDLDDGELSGPSFEVHGLRSTSRMKWVRKARLELEGFEAHVNRLAWSHDEDWHLVDVRLRSESIHYAKGSKGPSLEGNLNLVGYLGADDPAGHRSAQPIDIRITLGRRGIEDVELLT